MVNKKKSTILYTKKKYIETLKFPITKNYKYLSLTIDRYVNLTEHFKFIKKKIIQFIELNNCNQTPTKQRQCILDMNSYLKNSMQIIIE